jgi:SAM-dependent methyltransferase
MIPSTAPPYAALASAYDATIGKPVFQRTRALFETLAGRFRLQFEDAVDLGCGTGLFCRYLALRWGAPVTGVDLSPSMLRIASRNCRGLPVRLCQADISRLHLAGPADLITCNFDTLNHLTRPQDARSAIQRAAEHLRPGGAFFFDFLTPSPGFRPNTPVRRTAVSRQCRLTQILRWSPPGNLLSVKVILEQNGAGTNIEKHFERLYPPAQVFGWLATSGLRPLCALDAEFPSRFRPLTAAARVVVLARRT